jgi:hypothetical protein
MTFAVVDIVIWPPFTQLNHQRGGELFIHEGGVILKNKKKYTENCEKVAPSPSEILKNFPL